jgi:alanine racemase
MSSATLTVDLAAITANWRALDALSQGAVQTGAVVKADAYGLGVGPVALSLQQAGVRTFFVALASEGATLRALLGAGARLNIFSGHMAGDTDLIRRHDLTPMLNSPEQAARHLDTLPGHAFGVQIDTGMNRLGMMAHDWLDWRDRLMTAGPVLVMSHLACADEPDHPMNRQQLAAFHELTDGLAVARSLAATGGILLGADYHFDLTRPGIGLYGGQPFAQARAVVALSAPVVQLRDVAAGQTVGYGNAWTAARPSRIATIAAGYADGLMRALGRGAALFHAGQPCPLVGRVSMDLITVDVTDLAEDPAQLDLLGPDQSVDDLAQAADTIGYEILTALGARYQRRYEARP